MEDTAEATARHWNDLKERQRREYEKTVAPDDRLHDHAKHWYSKQGVQTIVLAHLIESGWSLRWVGNCPKRDRMDGMDLAFIGEPVYDVEAQKAGVRLVVEAIGHPGSLDPRNWQADRRAGVATQGRCYARARYSDALFTGPGLREAIPTCGLFRHIRRRACTAPMY